jgi:TonB family protein
VTLLIGLAIRSSLMLALGLLLSASLARRSAALRHRVLAAALLSATIIIPCSLTLPAWNLTLPTTAANVSPATTLATAAPPSNPAIAVQHPSPRARPSSNDAQPFEIASLVIAAWLAGVMIAAGRLIIGVVRVHRIAASATSIDDPAWLDALATVASLYRLERPIVVSRTDSPDLLATWGVVRPHVLLPCHASGWTLDRLRVVLCHELAHIRRYDWLVQMAAETMRALLWFNPLAWIVCRRLRRESELACDDEVLRIGVHGPDYAAHLVDLARTCRRRGAAWAAAIPMAHPSTLERRITAMLNPRLDRHMPSRRVIVALFALLLLVALPVSVLRARQAGPSPLTGTIYDVSGAVMPGVKVTLVDANKNTWTAISNARGRFDLPAVVAGKYVLEVELRGFRSLRQEFELRDARDWDRAITLQVGELQETITVRSTRGSAAEPPIASQVRVGGNIRVPMKIKDVRPSYPPSMRDAGLTGVVPLEAIIGRDGTVTSVRVLSAQAHPDFAVAAVDAVRQWQFTPTLLNGQAVEVVMRVSITFDLD